MRRSATIIWTVNTGSRREKIGELEKLRFRFDLQDEPANFSREVEVATEERARELARQALSIFGKDLWMARTSPITMELTLEKPRSVQPCGALRRRTNQAVGNTSVTITD